MRAPPARAAELTAMRAAPARAAELTAMRAAVLAGAALALAACRSPAGAPAPGSPEALIAYLQGVIASDDAAQQREVRGWQLDEPAWNRTVVEPYRPLYADYRRAFAAEAPALAARLGHAGPIAARRHYAGDPRLSLSQARDRWALPVLFPSLVAEAGGAPIDTVFVADGAGWRALIGLDTVVRARVAALDPACAARLALAGARGRCGDVGAVIADAALRSDRTAPPFGGAAGRAPPTVDRDRLAHACRLAVTLCGKEAP